MSNFDYFDAAAVERCINDLEDDHQEVMRFCKKVQIHVRTTDGAIYEGPEYVAGGQFVHPMTALQQKANRVLDLTHLRYERSRQLLELESQAETEKPQEVEDEPAEDSTTAGRVMAVYYLLLAAGADYKLSKSQMGRLVCFLTGEKHGTIKRYWGNPLGNPESDETRKNRELIKGLFQKLNLKRAIELMEKD
jgi:hypothetical protein